MRIDGEVKAQLLELFYAARTHPRELRPTNISWVGECNFFPSHYNSLDGWFCKVLYADGHSELWFVVYGVDNDSTNDWYLELVHTGQGWSEI